MARVGLEHRAMVSFAPLHKCWLDSRRSSVASVCKFSAASGGGEGRRRSVGVSKPLVNNRRILPLVPVAVFTCLASSDLRWGGGCVRVRRWFDKFHWSIKVFQSSAMPITYRYLDCEFARFWSTRKTIRATRVVQGRIEKLDVNTFCSFSSQELPLLPRPSSFMQLPQTLLDHQSRTLNLSFIYTQVNFNRFHFVPST